MVRWISRHLPVWFLLGIALPTIAQQKSAPAPEQATTLQLPGARPISPEGQRDRALQAYLKTDPNAPETTGGSPVSASETLRSFLNAFPDEASGKSDRIVSHALPRMEFKGGSTLLTDNQRRELAVNLKSVLMGLQLPMPEALERKAGTGDVVEITTNSAGSVKLRKFEGGIWRFPDETIQALPLILQAINAEKNQPAASLSDAKALIQQSARDILPEWARKVYAGAAIWQWAALAFGLFGGLPIVLKLIRHTFRSSFSLILSRFGYLPSPATLDPTVGAMALVFTAFAAYKGLNAIGLPPWVTGALTYVFIVAAIWGSLGTLWFGLDALGKAILRRRQSAMGGATDEILINFLVRVTKILLLVVGLAFTGNAMGFNITALLAGLGLGGVAFALAAKNTIENVFGTITLLVDRPFRIGDRIKINSVEGIVTRVGLRSTRITTSTESAVTLPNHQFIGSTIENFGPVPKRIWKSTIALAPSNPPDRLLKFSEELRSLLKNHSNVAPESVSVRISDFGPRSLTLTVIARIKALDDTAEMAAREEMILKLTHLISANQIDLAPAGT